VTSSPETPLAPPRPAAYTIKANDTLYALALQYGLTVEAIMTANATTDPPRLQIGQTLVLPVE